MRTVTIIGVGRLGGALAIGLSRAGYSVRSLVTRSQDVAAIADEISPPPDILSSADPSSFDSEIIFITTGDRDIGPTVGSIASKLNPSAVVLHASGALSSDVLQPAQRRGNAVGSLHPLLSVSDPLAGSKSFRDVYFCVEGDPAAVEAAEEIAGALGGRSFKVDRHLKPLYHASAVLAAGHVTALFSMAAELLAACGPSSEEAAKILLPLVRSTVRNLATQAPEQALTGPFARADLKTVELHVLALLDARMSDILGVYLKLGSRSTDLAEKAGADPHEIQRLREYIKLAKGSSR